jgi:hypothetical protein
MMTITLVTLGTLEQSKLPTGKGSSICLALVSKKEREPRETIFDAEP